MRTIGDQELALLRDVAAHGAATVAEVVERFGLPRGLARSTVLTMMERLRKKGHLSRKQVDGVYRYAPRTAPGDVAEQVQFLIANRSHGRGPRDYKCRQDSPDDSCSQAPPGRPPVRAGTAGVSER